MTKSAKLKWRDLHVLRKIMRYTQVKWGRLLGMSQSAVSLHEKKHADEYVDPELVKKAVEGSMGSQEKPAEREPAWSGVPTPAGTWAIVFASEPLPSTAWLAEAQLVAGGDPQRRIFMANFEGTPPPTHGGTGLVSALPGQGSEGGKQARSASRNFGLVLAACLACCLVAGCMLSHRAPDESMAQEPTRLSERLCTDNATDGNGTMGTQSKRSIKMPDKPYSWQKVGPCGGQGYVEKVGGCWMELSSPAPCPKEAVEENGKCYVPVPADPAKPNTVESKK